MHTALISVYFFIFKSLMKEDDDKVAFKCPLLSNRKCTDRDVYLNKIPSPFPLFHIVANPSLLYGLDTLCGYP